MTLLALRIGNDVSYVSQITGDIDVAWQAQHLVRFPEHPILIRIKENRWFLN